MTLEYRDILGKIKVHFLTDIVDGFAVVVS